MTIEVASGQTMVAKCCWTVGPWATPWRHAISAASSAASWQHIEIQSGVRTHISLHVILTLHPSPCRNSNNFGSNNIQNLQTAADLQALKRTPNLFQNHPQIFPMRPPRIRALPRPGPPPMQPRGPPSERQWPRDETPDPTLGGSKLGSPFLQESHAFSVLHITVAASVTSPAAAPARAAARAPAAAASL